MPAKTRFASFCRGKRTALGLSLREFCRRNALDPGNVSRLERGIQPPPKSPEGLAEYAKALGLTPDSEDWHTLFELAAVETGRIPSPLLDHEAAKDRLPKVMRDLRARANADRPWVTSAELEIWANYRESQAKFPQLIRGLIHGTNPTIEQIEFPAGDGIQHRGWDGIVLAREASAFVPAGLSVWEIGTGADSADKANRDFASRTKNPLGINPSDATLIFVTARRWHRKGEWERAKDRLGHWRRVLVHDADTIESWLELAPAVDLWFARLLGKRPHGIRSVEEHWANLKILTSPNLQPAVFLASRTKDIEPIKSWLSEPASALAVVSRSPADAIDFFAAYLAAGAGTRADQLSHDRVVARTLIVENLDAWNSMSEESRPLNLIAAPGLALDAELVAKAVRAGHHVLLCGPRFNGSYRKLALSRPSCFDLQTALSNAGFDSGALEKAADCGGSLSVLKRRLARIPATIEPHWSHGDHAAELAFLLLIGRWNESYAGDRSIVEELAGRPYSEVLKAVHQWSQEIDPPIFRLMDEWTLTSREDSWLLLRHQLAIAQLETWERLAEKVLSDDDPRLDLPSSQRPFARLSGKVPTYSDALRTGMAETMAVMATVSSDRLQLEDAARAERIVAQILTGPADWKRWLSLSKQLCLLAEAAPDAFLDALNNDLVQQVPETPKLFADSDESFFSRCNHAELLWSLETLAWAEQFLRPSALILVRLAELDTGRKWGNRPIQSLIEILATWRPQTTAPLASRLKVLQSLAKRRPAASWKLFLGLLDTSTTTSFPTRQPKWRTWTTGNWPQEVTDAEFSQQIEEVGKLLLSMVETNADRWVELIKQMAALPKSCRQAAIDTLLSIDKSAFGPDELKRLADALRQQVRRNSDHPSAAWAMPQADVARLKEALERLEPGDSILSATWLFARWPAFPGNPVTAEAFDQREQQIADARQNAVSQVFREHGFEGVLRLAAAVDDEQAAFVGEALASLKVIDESEIVPRLLVDSSSRVAALARGFTYQCLRLEDWKWIDRQHLNDWSPMQVVCLANLLRAQMKTWELVQNHSEAAWHAYWESLSQFYGIQEESDFRYAADMLLQHKRPFAAAAALAIAVERKVPVDSNQVASALEAGLKIEVSSSSDRSSDLRHYLETLIQHLQSPETSPIDLQRLVALEFGYLQILDGHPAVPVAMHRALSVDPKFFADVIQSAFFPKNVTDQERKKGSDERQRFVAENAYRVLQSWDRIPGQDDDGTIDEAILHSWVRRARQYCQESGHLEICDLQIGELFAQSPPESDGSWPRIAVRDVMEEFSTKGITEGFVIGTLNRRGVTHRSPFDGGDQERQEMEKYESFAKQCDAEWSTTAKALRAVAQCYNDRAQREDSEAEARRLGRQ
jgi:transcriptional regulator with XRE-family HTH domain